MNAQIVFASVVVWVSVAGCTPPTGCGSFSLREGAPAEVALRPEVHRGICVAHNYQRGGTRGYGSATSAATLREIQALGATWVSLTPFGFMANETATKVQHIGNYAAGETDTRMAEEITAAHALGLRVLLKPHLWLHNGAWRGDIQPGGGEGWRDWFESYRRWILRYAKLSQANNVEMLVVGVELDHSAAPLEQEWRKLVRDIRGVYRGQLTYSANWDAVDNVPWWDALDFLGVQFYPPIAKTDHDQASVMVEQATDQLNALGAIAARVDRQILLTEVGYRSKDGAATRPYEWPSRGERPTVDLEEQSRAYRALFTAIRTRSDVAGVYWWKWFTDPASREEGPDGFSPRGKPAEAVMRAAFAIPTQ